VEQRGGRGAGAAGEEAAAGAAAGAEAVPPEHLQEAEARPAEAEEDAAVPLRWGEGEWLLAEIQRQNREVLLVGKPR
jgi:hypothetical protein